MRRNHDHDDTTEPGLALPRSFEARYGAGLRRAVCLGGGGTFFVAWQLGYLEELARLGVDLGTADRIVGTSAGSIVATTLAKGRVHELFTESELLGHAPSLMGRLFPSATDRPGQQETLDRYLHATDSTDSTVVAIGEAARSADTPSAHLMPASLAFVVGEEWDRERLWMTTVDTATAERCVVTGSTGVSVAHGCAASSAVPGIFAPQPVAGRECMDGGVCGTAIHLDLVAGAQKVLALSLYRDAELTEGMLTLAPGDLTRELDGLRGADTEVFFQAPEHHPMDVPGLMDPKAVPGALEMGVRQARSDVEGNGRPQGLADFWA